MPAEDWFTPWLRNHQTLIPYGPNSWPSPDDAWHYLAWVEMFDQLAITEDEAFEVSRKLQIDRPKYPDRHPEAIRLGVLAIRGAGSPSSPAGSLDAAGVASRDCPDCGGSGFAPRYVHPEIHGKVRTFGGSTAPVGARVVYPCSCPLGGFVAEGLRQKGQAARPLTVDQYPSLRREWAPWTTLADGLDNAYRYPPGSDTADSPAFAVPAELRDFCRSIAASSRMPARAPRSPGGPFLPGHPQSPGHGQARPLPGHPDLAPAAADPVIARELAPRPAPPALPPTSPADPDEFCWF